MAVTKENVFKAAEQLKELNSSITLAAIREVLGGGSFTTISPFLQEWKDKEKISSTPIKEPAPQAVLEQLQQFGTDLWGIAMDMANTRLAGEREALEKVRREMDINLQEAVELADTMNTDKEKLELAILENLQREDLNPMEEAYALERLQQEFDLTHQQIADTLGKSRAAISNTLRLMGLAKEVKLMLENGDLEMGHARALLALPEKRQAMAAREVVDKTLTVRQAEALVKQLLEPAKKSIKTTPMIDPNISQLQNDLEAKLGVPVQLKHKEGGAGQLLLKYNSLDELDGILAHIK